MDIRIKQRAVVEALEDVKGRDIVMFNVARQTAYFERVVIASGDSNRHVNALAASVQDKLKSLGARIAGVEGRRNGEWVLVDLGDIVVHIMHPAVRSHYNLEELWGEKEIDVRPKPKPKPKPTSKSKSKSKPKPKPKAKAKPAAGKKRARAKAARSRRRK